MRCCIINYLCSNCVDDTFKLMQYGFNNCSIINYDINSDDSALDNFDLIILPGGFAFGDGKNPGYVASRAPISNAIKKAASCGKNIVGICNGFQVLLHLQLLPGKLMQNENGFISQDVDLYLMDSTLKINLPIACGFGKYVVEDGFDINKEKQDRYILRYEDKSNVVNADHSIAGISNKAKNVFGMMPHIDRLSYKTKDTSAGIELLNYIKNA